MENTNSGDSNKTKNIPQSAPSVREYKRMGSKTFLLLFWKRCFLLILIILIELGFAVFYSYLPVQFLYIAQLSSVILFIVWLVILFFTLIISWLEYIHYKIYLSTDNIKICSGLITEKEHGIPFRRVKEVNFSRSLMDQIIGVTNVVLVILGEDEGDPVSKESRIILPALDTKIAAQIQEIVLDKAEVDEMEVNNNSTASEIMAAK